MPSCLRLLTHVWDSGIYISAIAFVPCFYWLLLAKKKPRNVPITFSEIIQFVWASVLLVCLPYLILYNVYVLLLDSSTRKEI